MRGSRGRVRGTVFSFFCECKMDLKLKAMGPTKAEDTGMEVAEMGHPGRPCAASLSGCFLRGGGCSVGLGVLLERTVSGPLGIMKLVCSWRAEFKQAVFSELGKAFQWWCWLLHRVSG